METAFQHSFNNPTDASPIISQYKESRKRNNWNIINEIVWPRVKYWYSHGNISTTCSFRKWLHSRHISCHPIQIVMGVVHYKFVVVTDIFIFFPNIQLNRYVEHEIFSISITVAFKELTQNTATLKKWLGTGNRFTFLLASCKSKHGLCVVSKRFAAQDEWVIISWNEIMNEWLGQHNKVYTSFLQRRAEG